MSELKMVDFDNNNIFQSPRLAYFIKNNKNSITKGISDESI